MVYKLIWSPSARLDLKDIAVYIAEDNPLAGQRFVNSVFESVERLSDFPDSEMATIGVMKEFCGS